MSVVATVNEHLPGVLRGLEPLLDRYGYLAVVFLVLLEDFGLPVPGETALILGAVYAATGRLSIAMVTLLAFLGAVAGDNIGFALGHFGGRPLAERYGSYVFLTRVRLENATAFFNRHGAKIIVVARFVEGLRQANGIIAGITGMRWRRFLVFNAIGAALWVAAWIGVGYFSGSHIDAVYSAITRYDVYVVPALVVVVLGYLARRAVRSRVRHQRLPGPGGHTDTPG